MQGASASTDSANKSQVSGTSGTKTTRKQSIVTDFADMLAATLSSLGKKRVSEEELFSAICRERVAHYKGDKSADKFDEYFSEAQAKPVPSGYVPSHESSAKEALQQLIISKKLSADEANMIYSQSFAAAQIDNKADALYDDIGSTQATADLDTAIAKAQSVIAGYDNQSSTAPARNVNETADPGNVSPSKVGSNGSVDGAGGFFYKAFSDIDGNVLVIAPESMAGNVERVDLKDQNGRVVDSAHSTGIGFSKRDYIRFKKSGSEYPMKLTIDIVMKTGGTETYQIPDSSLSWE